MCAAGCEGGVGGEGGVGWEVNGRTGNLSLSVGWGEDLRLDLDGIARRDRVGSDRVLFPLVV